MEWTIWSAAPLSIIHSVDLRFDGGTRLEEKTEWSRLMKEARHKCASESIPAILGKIGWIGCTELAMAVATWGDPRENSDVDWLLGCEPKAWEWSIAISC